MSVINSTPLLLGDDGYQISRSVRLRSSASAYFNRAAYPVASAGTQWTMSMWVKRGTLGIVNLFSFVGTSGSAQQAGMMFDGNNNLRFWQYAPSTYQFHKVTIAEFRDPSAWYHVVFVYNTTLATAADRCQIWVNGIRQTSFSTSINPAQNLVTYFKTGQYYPYIGGENRDNSSVQNPFDGYLTEVNFIDGQALTPSSFGETNAVTGVWQSKKYTGTYGTNGFYLNFSDNSAATAAAIGKDYSGNGNNWTPNNISVTAGVTYDSMLDVPTLYADGGNGRGNYAVSNIADIDRANITTSNGNLTLTKATASDSPRAASTIGVTSGKYYVEITWASITNSAPNANYLATGVTTKEAWSTTSNGFNSVGYFAANAPGAALAGYKQIITAGSAANSAYGANYFTNGSVIGIALDLDAGTVTFYKDGTSQGAITLPTTAEPWFPYCTSDGSSNGYTAHWNFGQRPFAYTPPTGFKALNTQNLPDSTIKAGNTYFDVVTRSGFGASGGSISSLKFQPDFSWSKARNIVASHNLIDSVRGVTKLLSSDTTTAEATVATYITSFNSNGYTIGAGDYATTTTAVDWLWKAGGAPVSNTAGSIASQVSAGMAQGFSVVTYTGTGANATVGHGLGVAPKMVIIKQRNNTVARGWNVYQIAIGNTKYLNLESTIATVTNSNRWNNTTPTSSVFTIGSSAEVNENGKNFVAYSFSEVAGFSKFGSYTGNGSTDGPFVYLGFRPKFVMVKRTDVAGNWIIEDSARDPFNVVALALLPNTAGAELTQTSTNSIIDFVSNGFKLRGTGADSNASAGTYIYMAFAENPFKNSLAR